MQNRMIRKCRMWALVVLLALSVQGCGSAGSDEGGKAAEAEKVVESGKAAEGANPGGTGGSEATESAGDESVSSEIFTIGSENSRLKVGLVTDNGGIEDHSYNQSAWNGMLNLNESIGARVSHIKGEGAATFPGDIDRLIEDGCDFCWAAGYEFTDGILEVSKKYPDSHFGILDYAYDEVPGNVTCVTFRAEEPSFLTGYIAASVTKTGKIGFIGGMRDIAIDAFQYGYEAGAAYADHEKGSSTEVIVEYADSYTDSAKGKKIATSMYDAGCDVVFHAAGAVGIGVIEAAGEADRFVIGVDCDQSYLDPEHVLTSAMKKVEVAVENVSVQYNMGDNVGGKVLDYGLTEHAVGIPEEHGNYSDEIYEEAMRLTDDISFGSLTVPKNEAEFQDFLKTLE